MMKKSLLARLLLGLFLFAASAPCPAQTDRDSGSDPLYKLKKAGWRIEQEGVLRREPRPNEIETFVFGVEGFTWKLRDLRSQLRVLRREFQAGPTPELRRAIESHRKAIASTLEMIERARAAEAGGEAKLSVEACSPPPINFAYDADASLKTERQGVWANASADFSVDPYCLSDIYEPSGEVYAYAFAKTTVNGAATTSTVTDGPRSGSNVNASADASRNGGPPCESFAYATVTSSDLDPSSYSRETLNESCPSPSPPASPLQVTVTSSRPSTITLGRGECAPTTWTVNISGGTSTYNSKIYWNDTFVGHETTYSRALYYDSPQPTIRAEVTDSGGQSRSTSHTTTIYYDSSWDGEPGCVIPLDDPGQGDG
jgi:hypothetical protein